MVRGGGDRTITELSGQAAGFIPAAESSQSERIYTGHGEMGHLGERDGVSAPSRVRILLGALTPLRSPRFVSLSTASRVTEENTVLVASRQEALANGAVEPQHSAAVIGQRFQIFADDFFVFSLGF